MSPAPYLTGRPLVVKLSSMARKPKPLSDQLRRAIRESDLSRYAICKATGIDQSAMSKFLAGRVGLGLASVDRLADFLGLKLVKHVTKKGR